MKSVAAGTKLDSLSSPSLRVLLSHGIAVFKYILIKCEGTSVPGDQQVILRGYAWGEYHDGELWHIAPPTHQNRYNTPPSYERNQAHVAHAPRRLIQHVSPDIFQEVNELFSLQDIECSCIGGCRPHSPPKSHGGSSTSFLVCSRAASKTSDGVVQGGASSTGPRRRRSRSTATRRPTGEQNTPRRANCCALCTLSMVSTPQQIILPPR